MEKAEQIASELYKLSGRFKEVAQGATIINGKDAVLVTPEVLIDIADCLSNWADVLLENREEM